MMSIKSSSVCLLLHHDHDGHGLFGHHLPLFGAQKRPGQDDQQCAVVSCARPLHSLFFQVGGNQFAFSWLWPCLSEKISLHFQTNEQHPVGLPLLNLPHYRVRRRFCLSAVASSYSLEVTVIVLSVFSVFSAFSLFMLEK